MRVYILLGTRSGLAKMKNMSVKVLAHLLRVLPRLVHWSTRENRFLLAYGDGKLSPWYAAQTVSQAGCHHSSVAGNPLGSIHIIPELAGLTGLTDQMLCRLLCRLQTAQSLPRWKVTKSFMDFTIRAAAWNIQPLLSASFIQQCWNKSTIWQSAQNKYHPVT